MSNVNISGMPAEVAVPFSRLIQAGQVDEEAIAAVLDAGSLDRTVSGNPQKLLAFLSGYVCMQSKGVPVKDTIRMAAKAGRRINLGWSVKRWQQEHDRLSRAETLAQLAGANVTYDVSTFAAYLPPHFPGYLIPNSRRPGMEGLRQRHCVASYHESLRSGTCAIAAVFIDHVRWTVQIVPTGARERPLRIGQIRTRFNETPTGEDRKRIHAALGIEWPPLKPSDSGCVTEEGDRHAYQANLRRVLPVLRELGAGSVVVEFDGSGDSGSIEGVDFLSADCARDPAISEAARATTVDIARQRRDFDPGQGRWVAIERIERAPVRDAIEEIAYDYLDETDVDWYNNDGGYGTMEIDINEGTVSMEISTRFTESVEAFSRTFEIDTGEDIGI